MSMNFDGVDKVMGNHEPEHHHPLLGWLAFFGVYALLARRRMQRTGEPFGVAFRREVLRVCRFFVWLLSTCWIVTLIDRGNVAVAEGIMDAVAVTLVFLVATRFGGFWLWGKHVLTSSRTRR